MKTQIIGDRQAFYRDVFINVLANLIAGLLTASTVYLIGVITGTFPAYTVAVVVAATVVIPAPIVIYFAVLSRIPKKLWRLRATWASTIAITLLIVPSGLQAISARLVGAEKADSLIFAGMMAAIVAMLLIGVLVLWWFGHRRTARDRVQGAAPLAGMSWIRPD